MAIPLDLEEVDVVEETKPKEERIADLVKAIRYHKVKYYIDNKPEISDNGCVSSSQILLSVVV